MTLPLQKRLDEETRERMDPLIDKFNNHEDINISEIFGSPAIPKLFEKQSIFLPGGNDTRLRMSIPFYETVFVEICSACECVRDPKPMLPLLRTEGVVPVLLGSYSDFNSGFVKEITKLPHIAYREFMFYRSTRILAESKLRVCEHCVKKKKDEILRRLVRNTNSEYVVNQFFSLLRPFVDPDYELIAEFAAALDAKDSHRLNQVMQLAWTVNALRSSQAFHAAQTIPLDQIQRVPTVGALNGKFAISSPEELVEIASDQLGLTIPKDIGAERYLSIVLPHRAHLAKLVREVVDQNRSGSTTKLIAAVGEINDEIRRVEGKKRFLAYRAVAGFAAGNSSIIGAMLVAGALGLGGHFAGCGASVVVGLGLKALSKVKRLKSNRYLRDLTTSIHASIQPTVAKVLARYLGTTTRAVEVWQLRQELVDKTSGQEGATPRKGQKKSSITVLRRRKRNQIDKVRS